MIGVGSLITKPLLIGAGLVGLVLVAIIGVQTVRLQFAHADVATAEAAVVTITAERDTALASLATWKGKAAELEGATNSWRDVANERNAELTKLQDEMLRQRDANDAAVKAAQAAQRDIERTHRAWLDRYAERIRQPSCAAARAELDRACSVVEY